MLFIHTQQQKNESNGLEGASHWTGSSELNRKEDNEKYKNTMKKILEKYMKNCLQIHIPTHVFVMDIDKHIDRYSCE